MHIGWIGLGTMGEPMVRNLAAQGNDIIRAYNRSARHVEIGGATQVKAIAEAVREADVIFIMVSDAKAVQEVLFAEDGVVLHAKAGALIINMSTIGVDETNVIAEHLQPLGFEFMDAPVSGSRGPAEEGKLVILAGGDEMAYDRVQPLFARMGKASYRLGHISSGAAVKLLVNAWLGVLMQVSGECLAAADKFGVPRETLLDVLSQTAVWSPVMGAKRGAWVERSFEPAFALKHMSKDLGLMGQFATQLGIPTPTVLAALAMFLSAEADGHADKDMAAISEHMVQLSGLS